MDPIHSPLLADIVVRRVKVSAGDAGDAADQVAVEAPLELRIGRISTVLMRTPGHDEELATGFLYTEGLIRDLADLVSLARPENLVGDERGNVISVGLRP